MRGLKAALAEAAGKFSPDRTVLPIPDRNFGGTMGRTLGDSVADWTIIPGPKAPEDAPNVLIVLIDDAGFGSAAGRSTPAVRRDFIPGRNQQWQQPIPAPAAGAGAGAPPRAGLVQTTLNLVAVADSLGPAISVLSGAPLAGGLRR